MSSLLFRVLVLALALPVGSVALAELPVFDNNEGPVFIDYVPTSNIKASNCELYVNGFGDGSEPSYHAIGGNLYESWVRIWSSDLEGRREGTIRNVGAFFHYTEQSTENPTPVAKEALFLGATATDETNYFRIDFRYKWHNMEREVSRTVNRFAYFVDVQYKDEVTRYWLTNGPQDFTIPVVTDGYPRTGWISSGPGLRSVRYVENYSSSPIFDQRKACYRKY